MKREWLAQKCGRQSVPLHKLAVWLCGMCGMCEALQAGQAVQVGWVHEGRLCLS